MMLESSANALQAADELHGPCHILHRQQLERSICWPKHHESAVKKPSQVDTHCCCLQAKDPGGTVGHAGQIKSVLCQNFMCHSHFELNFL